MKSRMKHLQGFMRSALCLGMVGTVVAGAFHGISSLTAKASYETEILLLPGAEQALLRLGDDADLSMDAIYDFVEDTLMFTNAENACVPENAQWEQLQEAQMLLLARRDYEQKKLDRMYAEYEQSKGLAYEQYQANEKEKERLAELAAKKEAERKKAEAEAAARKKAKEQALKVHSIVHYANGKTITITNEDYECLKKIVQAEAGGEDFLGKQLVVCVILNRVASGEFPDSVKKVVFQQGQFSPIRNGSYSKAKASKETIQAIDEVLKNGSDLSMGALYFFARRYTTASKANWFDTALTKVMKHGVHEFYK